MKFSKKYISITLMSFMSVFVSPFLAQGQYTIPWYTIDGGGGRALGGNFEMSGTIGQHDAGPAMTGGSFEMSGGFWQTTSSLLTTVNADSINVILGFLESGQLSDVDDSDDARLCYLRGNPFSPTLPAIWLEFHGVLPTDNPSELAVTLEAHVNDIGISQGIEMYNFVTNQFENVDTRDATRNVDSVANIVLTGDVTRFVESGTGKVRTKVTYAADGTGFLLNWKSCIDQFIWQFD